MTEQRMSGLQVDVYGAKVRVTPKPDQTTDPSSWQAVAREINHQLMSIATNAVSLAADVLKAARSLVRGVGDLPHAVASRVRRAHMQVDTSAVAQAAGQEQTQNDPAEAALQNIAALLRELREAGIRVEIYGDKESSDVVFLLVPSDSGPPPSLLATAALLQARASTRQAGHVGDTEELDSND